MCVAILICSKLQEMLKHNYGSEVVVNSMKTIITAEEKMKGREEASWEYGRGHLGYGHVKNGLRFLKLMTVLIRR